MTDLIQCAGCGQKFKGADKFRGRTIQCPKCSASITVPSAVAVPAAPPQQSPTQLQPTQAPTQQALPSSTDPLFADAPLQNADPLASGHDPLATPMAQVPQAAQAPAASPLQSAWQPTQAPTAPARRAREPSAHSGKLNNAGGWLVFLGVGMSVLPLLGLQIKFQHFLGSAQPFVALALALGGAVCLFVANIHSMGLAGGLGGGVAAVAVILLVVGLAKKEGSPGISSGSQGAAAGTDHPQAGSPGSVPEGGPGPVGADFDPFGGSSNGLSGGAAETGSTAGQGTPTNESQVHPEDPRRVRFPTPLRGTITNVYGGPGGGPFSRTGPEGSRVTGVIWAPANWKGQDTFKFIEPLIPGQEPEETGQRIEARDGYALAGMEVKYREQVHAIRLVFMRIGADDTLDPSDMYMSEWLGDTMSKAKTDRLAADGSNVIGICGRKGLVLDAIGLVVED